MANEIYSKSWWGSGVCDNEQNWGYIYHSYANCGAPREPSFVEKFGEPISAYSLRNLTSNPDQALVQVSTNGEDAFDLVEEQMTIDNLKQYENLRVTKWYDQAGDDETLTAFFPAAPYLVKDGKIFSENEKPTIHFENRTSLNNQLRARPILDTIRTYNITSYSEVQEPLREGETHNIFQDIQKIPMVLLGWLPKSKLTSKVYTSITQNRKTILKNEEDNTFTFDTPTSQLNLYDISDGLRAPFNFLFGETSIMNVSEFILYPSKDENNEIVTDNLIEYYGIKSRELPPIGDAPIGDKPIGKF
tara:strand:+ start:196 stop:1104 length:909 start_codon:yes stop_codon:yes gene_type:complete